MTSSTQDIDTESESVDDSTTNETSGERIVTTMTNRHFGINRRTLLKTVGGAYLFGQVGVGVGGVAATEVCRDPKVDVVLVLDRSGSMASPTGKLANAKSGANSLVDALGPGAQTGLVSYSTNARRDIGLTSLDAAGKSAVKAEINSLIASGRTNIYDGVRYAHEELLSFDTYSGIDESGNARSGVPKIIVLLSDGLANEPFGSGSDDAAVNAATVAKSDGIRIFTIAYGSGADVALMGDIASPGDAYSASEIDEVEGVFELITKQICEDVNESPKVTVEGGSIDEGEIFIGAASFTDDSTGPWTVTINYGDGESKTYIASSPGPIDISHEYGDNGVYTVDVLVTDSEGAVGSALAAVTVGNLDPDVELDEGDLVAFPTGGYFLGRVGVSQIHSADASDPGSDDLTFTWNNAAGSTTTYYNDGSAPVDPDMSPDGTYPFTATDSATYDFASLGVKIVEVTVEDDDGGSDVDTAMKIVTGDDDGTRTIGFWKHQVRGKGRPHYSELEMLALLSLVEVVSGHFDSGDLDSLSDAAAVLETRGPGMRTKADSQLLAAWLNFVSGRVLWDEVIASRTAGELLTEADAIVADPNATRRELEYAKDIAEAINTFDE